MKRFIDVLTEYTSEKQKSPLFVHESFGDLTWSVDEDGILIVWDEFDKKWIEEQMDYHTLLAPAKLVSDPSKRKK